MCPQKQSKTVKKKKVEEVETEEWYHEKNLMEGAMHQGMQATLEAGQGEKMDSLKSSRKEGSLVNTLILAQWDAFWTQLEDQKFMLFKLSV